MASSKYEIDFTKGKMFGNIVRFAIPLIFSGILQNLFNTADTIVVGRFAGDASLAAVGSTSSLTHLIVNLFIGISLGATIVVSRHFGSKNKKRMHDASHTAIAISIISGIFLAILGFFISEPLLKLMGSPKDVLPLSSVYMKVYFVGMPFVMLYNFASGIMRSYGDTKRPLYYLTFSGVVNVGLNLIFVIIFHLNVVGVALATVISQIIMSLLTFYSLTKADNSCKIIPKEIKIHNRELYQIIRAGVPNGIQASLFSVSNVLIQSSVNSFGKDAIAAQSAASSVENFVYVAMNAFGSTCVTACAQNVGAKNFKRIIKSLSICFISVIATWAVMSALVLGFSHELLSLFTKSEPVIKLGTMRLSIIVTTYFIAGIMEVSVGALRGIGYSFSTMLISLFGVCGFRIAWIFTIFKQVPTLECLYLSYPISWTITALVQTIMFVVLASKMLNDRLTSPEI